MGKLDGLVALVTGGARGIGAGITRCLVEAGATVVVAQRNVAEGTNVLGAECLRADLSHSSQIETLITKIERRHGRLDVLVNNAGMMFEEHVTRVSEDDWDKMMAVNLKAPFLLTKHGARVMKNNGGGSIVNIGSIEGLAANPGHAAYCATKAGIHGLTQACAVDLGPDGIRVNAIAPGWIETDLVAEYIASVEDQEGFAKSLRALHPVQRIGQIDDVGRAAVFLADPKYAFITGQVLVVDGGRTAQLSLPESLRNA